ncbi:hypothetical protein [Streptomyces resistomycificus]|uniref:hypothetical protein n=1 Tax=Streptomyces resistomycificus TaxID=67356 RepID=UPI000AF64DF0|nr:hypothetical protein [Streptomyces resistomycificus]
MAVAVVLLTTALVIVVGLLAAAGAGKHARMDGATYPAAFTRAAITFAAVITLAAFVTAALAGVRWAAPVRRVGDKPRGWGGLPSSRCARYRTAVARSPTLVVTRRTEVTCG